MPTPADVTAILQTAYGWPVGLSPAPKATQKALDEPQTVEVVARRLESFLRNLAQNNPKPWGFQNPDPEGAYAFYRYKFFAERKKFWEYDTAIALGQITEPIEDRVPEATTVMQFFDNLSHLRDQWGYKLCDQQEYDRRHVVAMLVPQEWIDAGAGKIYQLAVLRGSIDNSGTTGFSKIVGPNNPHLEDIRGLDAQQWMENEAAVKHGLPIPWLPIRPAGV